MLEKLTHLDRNLSPQETTRREADKRRFKAFVHPRKTVVKFALHDGRTARDLAAQRLEVRDYDAAVEFLNDAEACFRWTGDGGALQAIAQFRKTVDIRCVALLKWWKKR